MPDAPAEPITCRTFTEAAGLAIELRDAFGSFHAALLLDAQGRSIDLHVFAGEDHQVSHAVCVAMALVQWLPEIHSVVLFSGVDATAELHEDDARLWQTLVVAFRAQHVELRDWLQTDAELVRSLTISCDTNPTWQRHDSGCADL